MLTTKLKTVAVLAAGLASVLLSASVVKANSIQISGVTTTLNDGVWDYAYSMSLTENNGLSATNPNGNSMFVFYDLVGLNSTAATFTAGTTATSDWNIFLEPTSASWSADLSSLISQGGTNVANDLASFPNVRFQYVGSGFTSTEVSAIGTAHLYSTNAPGLYGQFAARWIGATGETQVNSQSAIMPAAGQAVPLPAAAWMGISLMTGLGFLFRARRNAR